MDSLTHAFSYHIAELALRVLISLVLPYSVGTLLLVRGSTYKLRKVHFWELVYLFIDLFSHLQGKCSTTRL